MVQRVGGVIVLAVGALLVGGCSSTDVASNEPAPRVLHAAVDAVVYLQRLEPDGSAFDVCTGTLVAPNLVLTARHCTAFGLPGEATCSLPNERVTGKVGGGLLGADIDPRSLTVSLSADRPSSALGGPVDSQLLLCRAVDAVGLEIVHGRASNVCGNDLAWLILDRSIPFDRYPPVRREPPRQGDQLEGFGWGLLDNDALSPTLKRISVDVLAPASSVFPVGGCLDDKGELAGAVALPGEFVVSAGQRGGDSGGPVFDSSGAVVGVHSRQNPKPSGACPGYSIESLGSSDTATMNDAFVRAAALHDQGAAPGETPPGACLP